MTAHSYDDQGLILLADECDSLAGAAQELCEGGGGGSGGGTPVDTLDPLTNLAQAMAKAADWTARQLGAVLGSDSPAVDFTTATFIKQYAIVFAASSVLVLLMWLIAVAKRAIRGVPMTTAIGEAVGLLWLAVGATAFTPLVLYTVIGAAGAITDGLVAALGSRPDGLFNSLGADLKDGRVGGGPLMLAVVSAATLLLCGALWLLMVIRALGLYVGAILGVVIYAGLVDRDWWGHVRRWAGVMIGLIAVEPVIVIVLGLAAVLQTSDDQSNVVTGLAITVIALGVTISLIWKVPGWGDAVKVARASARAAGSAARTITGPASATAGVQHGIATHGGRNSDSSTGSKRVNGVKQNSVSGGIAAHSQRTPKKPDDS